MRIGYQGIQGSNSEDAAIKMAQYKHFQDVEFVPLTSSSNVVNGLLLNEIDYGVVAYQNNIGGIVYETVKALCTINYEIALRCEKTIHHALFVLDSTIKVGDINKIVSHEQALRQCDNYIAAHFPQAKILSSEDTATSAERLATGVYDKGTAVICTLEAGQIYNLFLLEKNIEDESSKTEFLMIKTSPISLNNDVDVCKAKQRQDFLKGIVCSPICMFVLSLLIIALEAFAIIYHSTIGFIVMALLLIFEVLIIIFRKKIVLSLSVSNVVGYWRYYSAAVSGQDVKQQHDYMRIVRITQTGSSLSLDGWICTNSVNPLFKTTKVLVTSKQEITGSLVYWYTGTINVKRNASITGVAVLEWDLDNPKKQINHMNGWYLGAASKEIGFMSYTRITKEEFDYLKGSTPYVI